MSALPSWKLAEIGLLRPCSANYFEIRIRPNLGLANLGLGNAAVPPRSDFCVDFVT